MEFCIELEKLSSSTRKSIARDTNIPELITALKEDSDEEVRVFLSVNPNVKEPTLSEMANDNYEPVRINAALHPNASDDTKSKIYRDDNVAVRIVFAENTSDKYWLERCAKDYDPRVRLITIDNPNMDVELAFWIVQHDSFEEIRIQALNRYIDLMSEEKRLSLLENSSKAVRFFVVSHATSNENILAKASADESADIRKYIAENTTNFDIIDRLYSEDEDARVVFAAWKRKQSVLLEELATCRKKCNSSIDDVLDLISKKTGLTREQIIEKFKISFL